MTADDMLRPMQKALDSRACANWPYDVPAPPPPSSIRAPHPSIAEQMGTDPVSKLARAIHDLADAIRSTNCEQAPGG